MNAPSATATASRPGWRLGSLLIVAVIAAAYSGSFSGPFLFDDIPSIVHNATVLHLWPLSIPLNPPHGDGLTVEGRPLLNLSFALNYAWGGYAVAGYHAVNLLIHLFAALTLWGVARRSGLPEAVALAAAIVWAVHPLGTEAVSYISQRAESLMALFYLLTLYCFIRGSGGSPLSTQSAASRRFYGLSVACCAAGMASKEVMASAPIIVLLYDRAFISGSLRAAWRARRGYYLALAATWLVLGGLLVGSGNRGATVGASAHLSRATYAGAQLHAIPHYLRLAFWPSPLIFDYGDTDPQRTAARVLCGLGVLILATATIVGLARRTRWGWALAAFAAILAPSSSLIPIRRQIMAEHRMYLALAVIATLSLALLHRGLGRSRDRWFAAIAALVALAAVGATRARNRIYASEAALYADSVQKLPENANAQTNWGVILARSGQSAEAERHLSAAVAADPHNAEANYNLGTFRAEQGRLREGWNLLAEANRLEPGEPRIQDNLANAARRLAIADYNQAYASSSAGQSGEAIPLLEESVRLDPNFAEAELNLANALAASGQVRAAIPHYEAALRLKPGLQAAETGLRLAKSLAR